MDAIGPSAPQAQAPSGIQESTAQVPIPTAPKAALFAFSSKNYYTKDNRKEVLFMDTTCMAAGLFPHPPIMIPEVGGKELSRMALTVRTEEEAMKRMVSEGIDTVVIISPHNLCFYDGPALFLADTISGSLSAFGRPDLSMTLSIDPMLSEAILKEAEPLIPLHRVDKGQAARYGRTLSVDWGTFVPMYYLLKAGFTGKAVMLSPCFSNYEMNEILGTIAERSAAKLGRRIGVIASGDLSHKLTKDSPNGYTPKGILFDQAVMDALKRRDKKPLTSMTPDFIEEIGMCGLPSVYFLFGVLGNRKADMPCFSHEGPFGVGYGVCLYLPENEPEKKEIHNVRVELARESIRYFLEYGKIMKTPDPLPAKLKGRAGAFVSLHEFGALRGCIGTFLPCYDNVAEEIIHNAKAAACDDPRFPPLSARELSDLTISVDILSTPEPASLSDLDAKKYGVIVEKGTRRGLLLPDLDGVDTPEEQIAIAKRKAGIGKNEKVKLYRFCVKRYY